MVKKNYLIKQTIILITCRIIMLFIGFLSKRLIIEFIADEYLGLNSLFSSLLGFLNLAELGLGTAVSLSLYKPLIEKDYARINSILHFVGKFYLIIGTIVFALGASFTFFVPYLIKDNPFDDNYIRLAFLISVFGSCTSYLFSDKRLYYVSNEKYWITILFDTIFRLLTLIIAIIFLYFTREYLYFIGISELYLFFSNVALNFLYKKRESISKEINYEIIKEEKKKVFSSLKDLIPSKIGGFIFQSTDAILISILLGLSDVGSYSNYLLIFTSVFGMISLVCNSLGATFGKLKQSDLSKEILYDKFKKFLHIVYAAATITSISIYICIDTFVLIWMGNENYVLSEGILLLFVFDFYFHTLLQPYVTINMAFGDLKFDKIISIISLIMNVSISIIFGYLLGLIGIILGTFVSNLFNYISRVIYVSKKDFSLTKFKTILIPSLHFIIWIVFLCFAKMIKYNLLLISMNEYLRLILLGISSLLLITVPFALLYLYFRKNRYKYEKYFEKKED